MQRIFLIPHPSLGFQLLCFSENFTEDLAADSMAGTYWTSATSSLPAQHCYFCMYACCCWPPFLAAIVASLSSFCWQRLCVESGSLNINNGFIYLTFNKPGSTLYSKEVCDVWEWELCKEGGSTQELISLGVNGCSPIEVKKATVIHTGEALIF